MYLIYASCNYFIYQFLFMCFVMYFHVYSSCSNLSVVQMMVDIQNIKWKCRRKEDKDMRRGMITSIDTVTQVSIMFGKRRKKTKRWV